MDTGQHENLPPGLASAAPRSLVERGQMYNPRTAHKDYPSPRTPHKEQERRIQAPTSMERIRTVPRSYRTLTESKVLTLDKFLADIATCEEFLARTPTPSGDLTARGKSSPRGEGNRTIGLQEQQNVALYNPQQETFSTRFSWMVQAPDTPAEQSLSRRLTAPVECDESPHDNTTDTTTEYSDVLYQDLQGLPIAHRFHNPLLFVQDPQPLPVASVEGDDNPHKTDTAMTAAMTRTKSGRSVKNPLARDSSVPNTSTQPTGESRHETMDSSTGTNTPDTAAKGTTRTDARTEVPTHTAASMDTTRTVQDTPAQVVRIKAAAQPSRTSARTKRNPACTAVVATHTGTVTRSATITRTSTSTRSGRFSREDAHASTDASTNTSAKEKSGTRFGTNAAHTRTQVPGSQQAHGIRSVPDPTPSAASSADVTVQEPPVPPKPPDLFQRQAAPHSD